MNMQIMEGKIKLLVNIWNDAYPFGKNFIYFIIFFLLKKCIFQLQYI